MSVALDAILIAAIRSRVKGITDFAVNRDPFLKELSDRKKIQYNKGFYNGKQLFWNPSNGYISTVKSIGDYQNIASSIQDKEIAVPVPFSNVTTGVAWSETENRRAKNNAERDTNFDLVANRMNAAKAALANTLATDLHGDGTQRSTDTNVMIGLKAIVSASSTLYGIDRSTSPNAYARSASQTVTAFNTEDGGGTKEGITKMRKLDRTLTLAGKQKGDMIDDGVLGSNEGYDIILMDSITHELYESSFDSRTRFADMGKDGGIGRVLFKGKPCIPSPFMFANAGLFLNLEYFFLECAEKQGLLFDEYGKDETNNVRAVALGGQHCFYCTKPSAQGLLTVNG